MMPKSLAPLAAALLLAAAPAYADSKHGHGHAAAPAAAAADLAEAEVKKVDKGAGKVTLKHGPLPSLDMPPMTMVFRVKDPAMLDRMKAGDRIRFKAAKIGGNYTVTELAPAK